MNLHQLRAVSEVVKQGLSISAAAENLHTSQPGVSRQILELERELDVGVFVRKRNRLIALTEPGRALVEMAQRILRDVESMRNIARDHSGKETGSLTIATTHVHAYYTLPKVIQRFSSRYPRVQLRLREGTPALCADIVASAEADIAIVTESPGLFEKLITLSACRLSRCLVAPVGHPLLKVTSLTLKKIASYPLITYDKSFSSRRIVDQAFAREGLEPNIVLSVIDADVGKKYASLGLGVALLPTIAYDPKVDKRLRARTVDHLIEKGTVYVCLRKNSYLRSYVYAFISMFAPHLTRALVSRCLDTNGGESGPPPPNVPLAVL